jgi:hypothetical protein
MLPTIQAENDAVHNLAFCGAMTLQYVSNRVKKGG